MTTTSDGRSNGNYQAGDVFDVERPYGPEQVARLRGSLKVEHTFARRGAERLREQLREEQLIAGLGALSGAQAMQQVKAGVQAIYVSGWQVAADANVAGEMYPDQSLYPVNSVPELVKSINQTLQRADQIAHLEDDRSVDWFVPVIADAEAGFGGALNVFELAKSMIQAGAAGIHLEDQLASEKKCGHMGGKVLLPTSQAVRNLIAARLAADVMDVPTVIIARTDAEAASLITSDHDPADREFLTGERTAEGFYVTEAGLDQAIARGLAYAPYADLVWCETSEPNLEQARDFAAAIHARHPGKLLAYNCSPSFNWTEKLSEEEQRSFQAELAHFGYRFQFVTLAGYHALNLAMFELARDYRERGMAAYAELQRREFESEEHGYTATRHQREVGAGYFDAVSAVIAGGATPTQALAGSTEEEQFA
jgi:isocitrate lyase